MALGKNTNRIRLFGGNDFQLKVSSSWTNVGHLLKGQIMDETDSQEVVFSDGNSIEIDGKRKVKLVMTLAQTSKEEMELLDDLRGSIYEGYYYNGIIDGKHQEFYFKALNVIPKMNLEIPGSPMQVVFEFSVNPQSSDVSVTPDTDLPSSAQASGVSPVAGKNPYYVILETAAS